MLTTVASLAKIETSDERDGKFEFAVGRTFIFTTPETVGKFPIESEYKNQGKFKKDWLPEFV